MKKKSIFIIAAIVVFSCFIIFMVITRTKVLSPPIDECGYPPGPFYGNAVNVELALKNTLAVFKGIAEPKVIDIIPLRLGH